MRKIDPEWELKIFDLLEGNLSEAEARSVLSDIMLDDLLREEYESMQAVYIEADSTIIFPDKSKLYKGRKGYWYLSGPVKYAIAAGFAILLSAGIVFYSRNFSVNSVEQGPFVLTETGKKTTENHSGTFRSKENAKASLTKTSQNLFFQKQAVKNSPMDTTGVRKISVMVEKAENQTLVSDFSHIASASLRSGITEQIIEIPEADMAFDYIPYMRKRSLSYRLLSNTRIMLADLRLPELSMKAARRKNSILPSLRLHLRSGDTEIMATLIE